MGLFNRKKNTTPAIKPSKEKAIYEYKMMEQVNCDLDAALSNPNPGFMDFCKIIAENDKYRFCSYKAFKDNSGGYVIRQNKANPAEKLFFGENFQMACIYKSYLFQSGHSGERGRFYIFAKNIETGNVVKCDWLGKGDVFVNINGYGRFYVQDTINDFGVENDELVFHIKREKSNNEPPLDKYDIDTEYILKVTIENGQFKPVAIFNVESEPPEKNDSTKETVPKASKSESKSKNNSGLGRDEDKHISCDFEGHEDDCPKDCKKCAISIKTDGDIALSENKLDLAIRQYKRAVFVEPKFAEAWVNLGNAYGMKSEYNIAIKAFDKAISIDPTYGKALFGKAITLRNLGMLDEAMDVANDILEMYDNEEVKSFKQKLMGIGVKDKSSIVDSQKAKAALAGKAGEVMRNNNLLDDDGTAEIIHEIYQPKEFTKAVLTYCKRKYASLGEKKIHGECIITSFYGSICATIFNQRDPSGMKNCDVFSYLNDHIDIEFTDVNAEHLLGTKDGEEKAEAIWSMFTPYLTLTQAVFETIDELTDEIILEAMTHAYVLGMLVAKYYTSEKQKKHVLGSRIEIEQALKRLAESSKDYQNPPQERAMCYSIRTPEEVKIPFRCSKCGQLTTMTVYKGSEHIFDEYRTLTEEFAALGHKAEVMCLCDSCADRYFPSDSKWSKNNIVFAFTAKGTVKPVYSFPSTWRYNDFEYQVALEFLKGADTINKLSEVTKSKLDSDVYLKHVRSVIGDEK